MPFHIPRPTIGLRWDVMSNGEPTVVPVVAPAGWYAHPTMAHTQQYWDGHRWTDHVAPGLPQHVQQATARADEERHNGKLTAVGIVLLFVFPIGGFIAGCILLGKRATTAGALIMVFSVVSGYVWYDYYTENQRQQCLIDNLSTSYPVDCG